MSDSLTPSQCVCDALALVDGLLERRGGLERHGVRVTELELAGVRLRLASIESSPIRAQETTDDPEWPHVG